MAVCTPERDMSESILLTSYYYSYCDYHYVARGKIPWTRLPIPALKVEIGCPAR
jgi:hypothetical protein